MVKRCGCQSDTCSCEFKPGGGLTLTGMGTRDAPFVVDVTAVSRVVTKDTASMNLTLSGTGEETSPYQVAGDWVAAAPTAMSLQRFNQSGTWVKPTGRLLATVTVLGAGGGGASGSLNSLLDLGDPGIGPGGEPGRPGERWSQTYVTADLPATVPVGVGTGGLGGVQTADAQTVKGYYRSVAGTNGTSTSFGTLLFALGGVGGPISPAVPVRNTTAGHSARYGGGGGAKLTDESGGYGTNGYSGRADVAIAGTQNGGTAGTWTPGMLSKMTGGNGTENRVSTIPGGGGGGGGASTAWLTIPVGTEGWGGQGSFGAGGGGGGGGDWFAGRGGDGGNGAVVILCQ